MALKLMYITNNTNVAKIAEASGVDRIFVDMEYIGKDSRQGGMDTVKLHHTIEDIKSVKSCLTKSEVLVRVNPIHQATKEYCSSKEEINDAIDAGADILMLPYFKTIEEVNYFVSVVNGRVATMLLVETPESVDLIDEILKIEGINEYFVGLNDLSLGYKKKFMFELLTDGTIEKLSYKFKSRRKSFGFGGIASIGKGMLPAEYLIKEHYRLGSTCVILSRSFCNVEKMSGLDEVKNTFTIGLKEIRCLEKECESHCNYFIENRNSLEDKIESICSKLK